MEQTNVLHPGNRQADVKPFAPKHHSSLNISNRFRTGLRFGQLGVCECIDSVPKDDVPLRSAHSVRSYTLGSQLMSDVYLKKDWFQVPRRAILPENFDKVYVNPPLGDDVAQDVGTSVSGFSFIIAGLLDPQFNFFSSASDYNVQFFKWLTAIQYFYSYGSLISALGYSMERQFVVDGDSLVHVPGSGSMNCDEFVDAVCQYLVSTTTTVFFTAVIDGVSYTVYLNPTTYGVNQISFRRFLELLHDDPSAFTAISIVSGDLSTLISGIVGDDLAYVSISPDSAPFDLAFPAAYQMTCAHFYSNDSIDFVYSADIYRQVVGSIVLGNVQGFSDWDTQMFFNYNGIKTPYDVLSAHSFALFVDDGSHWDYAGDSDYDWFLRLCSVLFAWRNSLRFMDYFTSAKSRPLSIGNVNVAVTGNNVNVIDVIEQTQRARFFNFANRSRRKLEGYLEDLFGVKPSHDWHNPLYLGHMEDVVYAVETENTGDAQLSYDPLTGVSSGSPSSVTSQFKSDGGDRFAFEVDVKEPSILLGIAYFDIPRCYAHATKRAFFYEDRFDMFNPFMQTIGDQALFLRELTDEIGSLAYDFPFGYKVRHAELKENFDRCKGPFATGLLSGWTFSDENSARGSSSKIDPNFIRSSSTELDKFYLSLTHYSLGNYFHFIVSFYNGVVAKRDMIVSPTLL